MLDKPRYITIQNFNSPRLLIAIVISFTAPFNYMQVLKFEAQLTNAYFATINQMFSGFS